MENIEHRPLVTLAMITFQQEKYVEEAFDGLVAQSYPNLEIVISDDASTDGTWGKLEAKVREYKGPVPIRLNRHERNLGLMANVLKVNSMAQGELLVVAAGDDISLPNRVERLVEFWVGNGRPSLLCSDAYNIDGEGNRIDSDKVWFLAPEPGMSQQECLKSFVYDRLCSISGCTEAWVPGLFHEFPEIPAGVITEDCVLTLRAWIRDGVGFIPDELVAYRLHDSNIWNVANPEVSLDHIMKTELKRAHWEARLMECYMKDLAFAGEQGWISRALAGELIRVSDYKRWRFEYKAKWLKSGKLTRVFMMLDILSRNIRYWKLIKWSLQWLNRPTM